jgi:hypothetical protein
MDITNVLVPFNFDPLRGLFALDRFHWLRPNLFSWVRGAEGSEPAGFTHHSGKGRRKRRPSSSPHLQGKR